MMNELRNLKEAKLTQMDLIREMKNTSHGVTPGGGHNEETEESKSITSQIKDVIIEKDALIEELQAMREQLDDRLKKIEQFKEDIIQIDRAIKRREDRCLRFDEQVKAGKEKLAEL